MVIPAMKMPVMAVSKMNRLFGGCGDFDSARDEYISIAMAMKSEPSWTHSPMIPYTSATIRHSTSSARHTYEL